MVSDLHKRYGDVQAVDGVSFEVARGEVFGMLGPNGAGKTTTVEILEGCARPTAARPASWAWMSRATPPSSRSASASSSRPPRCTPT